MKIEGRHSAVASDVDAAHDQLDLQDHLDELQLFGLRHYIFDHGARLRSRAELSQIQQRIGKPRSSSADSGDGSESMLRIRLLEQTVAEAVSIT
ncbi:MAG: hypothetical protein R3C68_14475 [Myxococcota bacterium]